MFAKLTGVFDSGGDDWLIIDVGGVGYLVFASRRTLANMPAKGGNLSLLIDTQVREDHIHLFGFLNNTEQELFKLLNSVQGVGAKVALAIQSVLDTDELLMALAAGDKAAVSRANGVGPKLAARIVNELKDKTGSIGGLGGHMPQHAGVIGADGNQADFSDAVSALNNLGYSASESHKAVMNARQKNDAATLEKLISLALKEMSK